MMGDYIELKTIGRGGYGFVVKVQRKSDGVIYIIIFYLGNFCKENNNDRSKEL